jgi:hypothetical protein
MASISQLTARLIDLFGSPATANPSKLAGNLTVSPNGNILVGQTTDNGTDKLQVTGSVRVTNTPLYLSGPAATYRIQYFQSGTSNRWSIYCDSATETGSNVGSNFEISRYNDSGAWVDNPVSINRANGQVSFASNINVSSAVYQTDGNINGSVWGGALSTWLSNNKVSKGGDAMTGSLTNNASSPFHSTGDIGISWSIWNTTGGPALQVDAANDGAGYMGVRWTHWGIRHLGAVSAYAGGSSSSTCMIAFNMNSNATGHVFYDGGNATFAGTLTQNSDYRIKTNVQTIEPRVAMNQVLSLRPVTYDRTDMEHNPNDHSGFIAHELQEVIPSLVWGEKDAVKTVKKLVGDTRPFKPGTEPEDYVPPVEVDVVVPDPQSVNYPGMIPYLVAAMQEMKREMDELRQELEQLKVSQGNNG